MLKEGDLIIVIGGHYGVSDRGSIGIVLENYNNEVLSARFSVLTGVAATKGDTKTSWTINTNHAILLEGNDLVKILYGVEGV